MRSKILNGRIILSVNLQIIYNETLGNNKFLMHKIDAGINYEKGFFRIYIKDNDKVDNFILENAYIKLKELFIDNFSSKNLNNEDKIKILLRGN
ncbi:hypothetical protein [Clostridium magnum]|uniref:hypothetical protein n=1 Tax=Clostridium magnum TaxID=33954 RepID=UPI0008301FDD|nr:hypothetical protein [Clostridium magnum]